MNINEEYAIEMLLDSHLKGREIGTGYIVAYMYECQITNPEKLDNWLLHYDYLRKPTIEETLSYYKVPELKELLSKRGLKVTGKKDELVERLISALSDDDIFTFLKSDKRYFLSEKGMKHYNDNIDLYELHRNWEYNLGLDNYFRYRKNNGIIRGFYETAYLIQQKKLENGVIDRFSTNGISSIDYKIFSEICENLGRKEDALKSILMKLYIDTNLLGGYYFDPKYIEIDGITELCDRLNQNQCCIFNIYTIQKIVLLSGFYSECMVDDIYNNTELQYVVFDRAYFKLAIDDMIQSAYFDASPYIKIIINNYRHIASNLVKPKNTAILSSVLNFLRKK